MTDINKNMANMELSDLDLASISGGTGSTVIKFCAKCCKNTAHIEYSGGRRKCSKCGFEYNNNEMA